MGEPRRQRAVQLGRIAAVTDRERPDVALVGLGESSIDIVLRRFAEYQDLQGAFSRRALIERAKGILMERHAIDEASAFELLRERSRAENRKLVDLATAVVDAHRLLPGERLDAPADS